MKNSDKKVIALGIAGAVLAVGGAVLISLADIKRSQWECPKCGGLFTPTLGEYILGVHTIHRRRLKCPSCGNISMCKHYAREEIFE